MTKYQKTAIFLIILILIAVGAYFAWQRNKAATLRKINETTVATDATIFTDEQFGFSIYYPKIWQVTKAGNVITMSGVGPQNDTITITEVTADKIVDTDSKFGNVTYYYETESGFWLFESDSDLIGNGEHSGLAEASAYTLSDLPIFSGTQRMKTNIVALATNKFLVFNISGSGYVAALDPLSQTVIQSGRSVIITDLNAAIHAMSESLNIR